MFFALVLDISKSFPVTIFIIIGIRTLKIVTVSQTSCARLADRRAHMVLLHLVFISLSYRGLERNCLLEYSSKTSIDGSCASSKMDFAGSSRFPGRF